MSNASDRTSKSVRLWYSSHTPHCLQHSCLNRWIWVGPFLTLASVACIVLYGSKVGLACLLLIASTAVLPAHPYWPAFVHSKVWDCWRRLAYSSLAAVKYCCCVHAQRVLQTLPVLCSDSVLLSFSCGEAQVVTCPSCLLVRM